MKIGSLVIIIKPTHLNDTVDGQVDNDIDDKEREYGSGYAHMVIQATNTYTTVF